MLMKSLSQMVNRCGRWRDLINLRNWVGVNDGESLQNYQEKYKTHGRGLLSNVSQSEKCKLDITPLFRTAILIQYENTVLICTLEYGLAFRNISSYI